MSMLDDKVNCAPERIQSSEFEKYVSKILFEEWDPIGVHDPDCFNEDLFDEYSGYEESVIRLAQAGDIELLAAYLKLTEQHVIGLEGVEADYRCTKVAYKLIAEWGSVKDKLNVFSSLF